MSYYRSWFIFSPILDVEWFGLVIDDISSEMRGFVLERHDLPNILSASLSTQINNSI